MTKRNNSCHTDTSAPFFLSKVHCLIVNVRVIKQTPYLMMEDIMTGMLKTVYPPNKTSVAGGIQTAHGSLFDKMHKETNLIVR